MKRINTELSFERIIKYLQCLGFDLEDWMYDKKLGSITFDYDFDYLGNFQHCYVIGLPAGGYKRGAQSIDFGEMFEDDDGWYCIKSAECEDILAFVREFESLNWQPSAMVESEDFSYLYDVDYMVMLPDAAADNSNDTLESDEDAEPPQIDETDERQTDIYNYMRVAWDEYCRDYLHPLDEMDDENSI